MIELSRAEHIEIIRALSEIRGGRLTMLNNTIPAYRKDGGDGDDKWVKLKSPEMVDAFKVEQSLGVGIHQIPIGNDILGGAAKVKDYRKLSFVIDRAMADLDTSNLETKQISNRLHASLIESGATIPYSDFKENLEKIIERHKHPRRIFEAIAMSEQVIVWPSHHLRMQQPPIPDSEYKKTAFGNKLQTPERITDALISAAREHYMRPERFVHSVVASLAKQNIALAFDGMPGKVGSIPDPMNLFLKEVLSVYKDKEAGGRHILEKAGSALVGLYQPLTEDRRTLGKQAGLQMLRRALSSHPTKSGEDVKEQPSVAFKEINSFAVNLANRSRLWSWRGIINDILENNASLNKKSDAINSRWEDITQSYDISISAPPSHFEELLLRVEKIYGPMVNQHAREKLDEVKHRIGDVLSEAEPVRATIEKWARHSLSPNKENAVSLFKAASVLDEIISPDWLNEQKMNFIKYPEYLPDMEALKVSYQEKKNSQNHYESDPYRPRLGR
jgi:hypothetical protein